eukprot:scaffold34550_cov54-Cyclotella_meneghiniana.AAC.9
MTEPSATKKDPGYEDLCTAVLLKIISFVMADTSSSRGLDDPGLDTRTRVDYDSDVIPNRRYSAIEESSDDDGQNFDTDDDGSSSDG